ncbi:uncharacterized protein LOC105635100 [Jatropha curcas]|uniref:uncharacterized protein LOC105635100 n=1 Tax=Jatropha curcas TaxID=180498 RepID=UPI00189540E0|nr:uncharacterized protein LOC105635100 [Jatropha curcas]
MHLVSSASTSADAWEKIRVSCANRNATRILSLRDTLSTFKRESRPVAEYLQTVKTISEDLSLSGSPVSDIDLVIHVLNGVGPEFCDISATVRARDSVISFVELQDKLMAHELYLKKIDSSYVTTPITANNVRRGPYSRQKVQTSQGFSNDSFATSGGSQFLTEINSRSTKGAGNSKILCQICERPGHIAKQCFRAKDFFKDHFPQPKANNVVANDRQSYNVVANDRQS